MIINSEITKVNDGSECVLVPVGEDFENGIFVLNETAERIYDLLCEGKSRDEIVLLLLDEYDTERTTAEKFTDDFIAKLKDAKILIDG